MADLWATSDRTSRNGVTFVLCTVERPSGVRHDGVRIESDSFPTIFLRTHTPAGADRLMSVLRLNVENVVTVPLPPEA